MHLTEQGADKVNVCLKLKIYMMYRMWKLLVTLIRLKAHVTLQRDVDYMVVDGEVLIVDQFTGRTMPGRRFSEGLHQAIEAKEGVKIQNESKTMASITFQNYFRMYNKLAV